MTSITSRTARRYRSKGRGHLQCTNGEHLPTWVVDISEGGLGLEVDQYIQPESRVLVELPKFLPLAVDRLKDMRFIGEVRYCLLSASSRWRCGVKFVNVTTEDRALLEKLLARQRALEQPSLAA